jgi:hypothetical protein
MRPLSSVSRVRKYLANSTVIGLTIEIPRTAVLVFINAHDG